MSTLHALFPRQCNETRPEKTIHYEAMMCRHYPDQVFSTHPLDAVLAGLTLPAVPQPGQDPGHKVVSVMSDIEPPLANERQIQPGRK